MDQLVIDECDFNNDNVAQLYPIETPQNSHSYDEGYTYYMIIQTTYGKIYNKLTITKIHHDTNIFNSTRTYPTIVKIIHLKPIRFKRIKSYLLDESPNYILK